MDVAPLRGVGQDDQSFSRYRCRPRWAGLSAVFSMICSAGAKFLRNWTAPDYYDALQEQVPTYSDLLGKVTSRRELSTYPAGFCQVRVRFGLQTTAMQIASHLDKRARRIASAGALALLLCGCTTYQAVPLANADAVLRDPDRAYLARAAESFHHPRLKPVVIDFSRPLTPDELSVIAVIANPDLKSARAKAKVTDAQVFQAGLLPDPQFNLGYDKRLSGPDPYDGWAVALIYELNAFRTRAVTVAGEKASQRQVRADLAWQEWQTAGQARLLAARITALQAIVGLNLTTRDNADRMLAKVVAAAARGDVKADEVQTRRIAAADAADKARQAERDLSTARSDLSKLLGLAPESVIAIAPQPLHLTTGLDAEALFERARSERLDLTALRAGYDSQEAAVRKAVMDAFPSLQLTLTRTQDTAKNQTFGPAVNFTLPLWNRNRGGIAVAKATRDELKAEYAARLFTTRADIAELVHQLGLEARQHAEISAQTEPLRRLVTVSEAAAQRGDISRSSADATRQAVSDKELTLAVLDQAMAEQRVTLELAVGELLPEQTR
jgi:cobalt-zinc-cadmium efflux system outer membrane protein